MDLRYPVVGFDLDRTLVDPRPGVRTVIRLLAERIGASLDADAFADALGPPLESQLAELLPAAAVGPAAQQYRELYAVHGVPGTRALPGATAALAAVRAAGGRPLVVTAKRADLARGCLGAAGIEVADVAGWRWAEGKAEALAEAGAGVYVGDHPADMAAAVLAGAVGVGVCTGSHGRAELLAAGAEVVCDDLQGFPAWWADFLLAARLDGLRTALRGLPALLVAFSGGTDSAFLLAAAVDALGPDRVLAATAVSPSLPTAELAAARRFAAELGVRHLTPGTAEAERPGYRRNAGDRCYFCKAELLDTLAGLVAPGGLLAGAAVATGTNADDLGAGFRPGIRAAAERGALAPLAAVGLTKSQVRAASRARGLSTWDKPAAACLASRIAYGIEVTPARLSRVERAEVAVRTALIAAGYPVTSLRVRDLGDSASVEVDAGLADLLARRPDLLADVPLGAPGEPGTWEAVTVDPRGYRPGSMNELLADPERYR